jgi:hypothetical protein
VNCVRLRRGALARMSCVSADIDMLLDEWAGEEAQLMAAVAAKYRKERGEAIAVIR